MKVTKSGVTFTNDEMRDYVFPILTSGLGHQMSEYSRKDVPRAIKKMLKETMDDWYRFAQDLYENTGFRIMTKGKAGYGIVYYSSDNSARFSKYPGGLVETKRIPIKKKK